MSCDHDWEVFIEDTGKDIYLRIAKTHYAHMIDEITEKTDFSDPIFTQIYYNRVCLKCGLRERGFYDFDDQIRERLDALAHEIKYELYIQAQPDMTAKEEEQFRRKWAESLWRKSQDI